MSRAYRTRRKAIRAEQRRLGVKPIPASDFARLQYGWRRALEGPYLGTLEDLLRA